MKQSCIIKKGCRICRFRKFNISAILALVAMVLAYLAMEPQATDTPAAASVYEEWNNNVPEFDEYTTEPFCQLSELDDLGRCGPALACFGQESMPEGERGAIGHIKPSGWHTVKYNGIVDGNYLYNRCHLLMWALSGINDDERNLITGTRYMNTEGMLSFEEQVVDYIEDTGNHVMYRVTPIFEGDNLVASGVQMEAASVEDDDLAFNVFCYNTQPGIAINYATGESWIAD